MLIRYALLVARRPLGLGLIHVGSRAGEMLLVDAGHTAAPRRPTSPFGCSPRGDLITFSLFRFLCSGCRRWSTAGSRTRVLELYARLGGVLYGVFYLACKRPEKPKRFLGEPGGGPAAATTGDARAQGSAGRAKVGRPSQRGRPIFFAFGVGRHSLPRRCNTCRTRSGAASSRSA